MASDMLFSASPIASDASPAVLLDASLAASPAAPAAALAAAPCVQPGSFLTLHYRLAGPNGDIINTFGGPAATITLGTGELSPDVEKHLLGLAEGARRSVEIPAGEAFGDRSPDRVQWVARRLLDEMGAQAQDYVVGDVVQFPTPDGLGSYAGAVRQIGKGEGVPGTDAPDGKADAVLFDFNHPLAGEPVTFEVLVIGVL